MKAIALISGGLDSMLAARVVKDLGIEIIGLHFDICFGRHRKKLWAWLKSRYTGWKIASALN